MKNLLPVIFLLLFSSSLLHAGTSKEYITMSFPESVISDVLGKSLPLTFEGLSQRMEGSITIVKIENLRIAHQQIFSKLHLYGKNLSLVTRVANQDIRLRLGSATIDFDCETRIRYDATKKKLYIRPIAKQIDSSKALQQGDIGSALALFLNGQEFAVDVQELAPILLEASNKNLNIHTQIVDIRAVQGGVQIYLYPRVAAVPSQ